MSMANETMNLHKKDDTNFFIRVLKYLFPCKGDKVAEVVRKFVFLASIVLFVMAIGQLMNFLRSGDLEETYIDKIVKYEPNFSDNVDLSGNSGSGNSASTPSSTNKTRELKSWASALIKRNSDVKGWIKIPNFKDSKGKEYINFPVLQGTNNDFYLTNNLDKKYYESGSIFADCDATITKKEQSDNITIFGHDMRYLGTSFTHLMEYKKSVDFLKKYPIIEFNSIYESGEKYVIVSVFVTSTLASQDDGKVFYYNAYRYFDDGEWNFTNWYSKIKECSWYSNPSINCTASDKYITLSTCTNECKNMRLAIVAKKVTENDDVNEIKKSYVAKADKDIYFPACWRNMYGNNKKYFGWDY